MKLLQRIITGIMFIIFQGFMVGLFIIGYNELYLNEVLPRLFCYLGLGLLVMIELGVLQLVLSILERERLELR